jgi:UDP-3-O-[3-hydroxymyristoyl] glucosamine N-acyltransferase
VEGADVEISGIAALADAGPGDLSFVRSSRHAGDLSASHAGAVIAPRGLAVGRRGVIRSDDPGLDFARAAQWIHPGAAVAPGIHPGAVVAPDTRVHPGAAVGPGCVVAAGAEVGSGSVLMAGACVGEGARVGADCRLHPRCVIGPGSVLGDRVVVHPGAVIGADGFGYLGDGAGGLAKFPQIGRVRVGDDVEIGACTTVDRGSLGETRIGRGSKIDNQVQIGHNCVLGEQVIIAAQVGLAGSTVVEDGAVILGQAGVVGHCRIGAGAVVAPQTGVHRDVPPGARVMGSPERPVESYRRIAAALGRLPALVRRVRALERRGGIAPPGGEGGPD